jgi:hypothetical protein
VTKYVESPRLLAALGPQPLWFHYHCVPVWEDADTIHVIGWSELDPAAIEDLSLIFGKVVVQRGTDEQRTLRVLIMAHAADQPISDLL